MLRCWYNAENRIAIKVGPSRELDHALIISERTDVFYTTPEDIRARFGATPESEKLIASLPWSEAEAREQGYLNAGSYFETQPSGRTPLYLVDMVMGLSDSLDDIRAVGMIFGWTCINCDPDITTIPYLQAPSLRDARRSLALLNDMGAFPQDDASFSPEVSSLDLSSMSWKIEEWRIEGKRWFLNRSSSVKLG